MQPQQLNRLKLAEQQFRLACTVHLAVVNDVQPLDVPIEWSFGEHRVSYEEFGLRKDQAPVAGHALEETAMLVLTGAILDAIKAHFHAPRHHDDARVVASYQIARIIRNAFAHSMIDPTWSIDADCVDKTFEIPDIISVCTTDLHGRRMGWPDYGGPLAIFRFGRFVREVLLGEPIDPNRPKPEFPSIRSCQIGRMVLKKVDDLPDGVVGVVYVEPGQSIDLGNGHVIRVASNKTD